MGNAPAKIEPVEMMLTPAHLLDRAPFPADCRHISSVITNIPIAPSKHCAPLVLQNLSLLLDLTVLSHAILILYVIFTFLLSSQIIAPLNLRCFLWYPNMRRVSAPSTDESGTIQSCMKQIDDDIIDLINREANPDFLKDDNLEDLFSLVTGDSAVNSKKKS